MHAGQRGADAHDLGWRCAAPEVHVCACPCVCVLVRVCAWRRVMRAHVRGNVGCVRVGPAAWSLRVCLSHTATARVERGPYVPQTSVSSRERDPMNRARAGRADMQMRTGALRLWARMYATRETERAERYCTRNFVDTCRPGVRRHVTIRSRDAQSYGQHLRCENDTNMRLTACATAMRINGAKRGTAHVVLSVEHGNKSSHTLTPVYKPLSQLEGASPL